MVSVSFEPCPAYEHGAENGGHEQPRSFNIFCRSILLFFYFLPNNPWRFCVRLEARNSMLCILHITNIMLN